MKDAVFTRSGCFIAIKIADIASQKQINTFQNKLGLMFNIATAITAMVGINAVKNNTFLKITEIDVPVSAIYQKAKVRITKVCLLILTVGNICSLKINMKNIAKRIKKRKIRVLKL